MAVADIQREILQAFGLVPKPAQASLISHQCCECEELAAALSPFTAATVPDAVLDRQVWDLPLLSDEGKHYYLPAWLLRALRPAGESAVDAVVYALDSEHRWRPQPPYTSEQWLVVDAWLAFVAGQDASLVEDIERVRAKLPK